LKIKTVLLFVVINMYVMSYVIIKMKFRWSICTRRNTCKKYAL